MTENRSDASGVAIYRREDLPDDPRLRLRARRAVVVRGAVERTFPARPRRRGRGRPIGRLHPSLSRPSRRALADLARRHRLARLVVFGSAVRDDFRPDSDVDVLIEPRPGATLGLHDVLGIRDRLEEAFRHDVEAVNARYARPAVRRRADAEGVVLYG